MAAAPKPNYWDNKPGPQQDCWCAVRSSSRNLPILEQRMSPVGCWLQIKRSVDVRKAFVQQDRWFRVSGRGRSIKIPLRSST
jgi:hypothetical protein